MKKLLRFIFKPLFFAWRKSTFRYSADFVQLRNSFVYKPTEEVLRHVLDFVRIGKVDGDYLEFGVAEGSSFTAAYHFAKYLGLTTMRFHAFDSFEGLPEIKGVDKEGYEPFTKGEFAYDLAYFRNYLSERKVNLDEITTTKGFYESTLNESTKQLLGIKKAAVVMIDCDLYESTVPVLDFIVDYLQQGTVLIFDDWYCFRGDPDKGEERALNEWLIKNPTVKVREFHKYGSGGISFIVYAV